MQINVRKKVLALAAVVAVACGFGANTANANLVIDLVATSVNGLAVADGHSVTVSQFGDVVNYDVIATITDPSANPQTSGVTAVRGALISTGSVLGTMTNVNNNNFTGTGFNVGKQFPTLNNLDGDGDYDVGAYVNNTAGVIVYMSSGLTVPIFGLNVTLGSGSFTVTNMNNPAETVLKFVVAATSSLVTHPSWTVNGVVKTQKLNPTEVGAGAGITVNVPEPASLGVLALGGLALLARRRK